MDTKNKYKQDIEKLCDRGDHLLGCLYYEQLKGNPKEYKKVDKKIHEQYKDESFKKKYNSWYNESLCLIRQLMPERLADFISYYKLEKRKSIDYETYTVSDYLVGLVVNDAWGVVQVDTKAVVSKYEQQLNIVNSLKDRFDSSLYEIRQLLQADLFDSEISVARELLKKGFVRAAGAVTGVVLEKHLSVVCQNHDIVSRKKNPSINDYNQLLKDNDVVDTPTWRNIQFLGDLRNLCDHGKEREPKKEEIEDLIDGTSKIMKTLF